MMQEGRDAPQRQTLTPRGPSRMRQRLPTAAKTRVTEKPSKQRLGRAWVSVWPCTRPSHHHAQAGHQGNAGADGTRNATSAPCAPPRRLRASSPRKRDPRTEGKSPPEGQLDRQACRCTHTHTPAPRHACATLDPNS